MKRKGTKPSTEVISLGSLALRLDALYEHLTHQPLTHVDSVDMKTIRQAADAIRSLNQRFELS